MKLILFILTLFAIPIHATQITEPVFYIEPGTCLIADDEVCEVNATFHWKNLIHSNVCIYQNNVKTALFCTNEANNINKTSIEIKIVNSTQFTLINKDIRLVQKLNVEMLGQSVRRLKRHVWSIF